jgi:hypothetical protein
MAQTGPEGRFRVRLHEILMLRRRVIELIDQLEEMFFPTAVDAAGALDGDGTDGDPLAVRVDGVTITINGSNQLEGTPGTPSDTVAALDGTGVAGASTEYSRGDHRHADANRPTDDQKAALVGTGTPSASNPYVTLDTLEAETGAGASPGDLPPHAETHEEGGDDEIDITQLGGYSGDPDDVLHGDGTWGPAGGGSPGGSISGTLYPIKFTADGQGADVTTGVKNYTALIPIDTYDGTIMAWNLRSPVAGSLEVNVRKNGASVTSGNNPALIADDEAEDTNLGDWSDVSVAGGDRFSINVLSCSGIEFFELQLTVERT